VLRDGLYASMGVVVGVVVVVVARFIGGSGYEGHPRSQLGPRNRSA
jgi:hypothetical protein